MTERFYLSLSAIACLFALSQTGSAHVGHLGELAGHSHWVGAAALGGAAVLAAWLAARSKKRGEQDAEDAVEDAETDAETVES